MVPKSSERGAALLSVLLMVAVLAVIAATTLDLNGFSFALGGINDAASTAGTIRNNGGVGSTLTVGLSSTNNVNGSYGGIIENGSGGVGLVGGD